LEDYIELCEAESIGKGLVLQWFKRSLESATSQRVKSVKEGRSAKKKKKKNEAWKAV
jgi:hypothetical protein